MLMDIGRSELFWLFRGIETGAGCRAQGLGFTGLGFGV